MSGIIETFLIFIVLSNLLLLGSSRIGVYIKVVALQGILLAAMLFMAHPGERHFHIVLLALVTMFLKGAVFPRLLFQAIRQAGVRREIEPFVGFNLSLLIGIAGWGFALWTGGRLPLPESLGTDLTVPTAMFTIFVGMFLIIARRNAITQVLGYLVMENGIYIFGAAVAGSQPFLVEMGMLLDIFVAVFVMVITLFQINREIGEIGMDTSRLATLRD